MSILGIINLCFKVNFAKLEDLSDYLNLWNMFHRDSNHVQGTVAGSFYRGRSLKSSRVESVDKSDRNGATLN